MYFLGLRSFPSVYFTLRRLKRFNSKKTTTNTITYLEADNLAYFNDLSNHLVNDFYIISVIVTIIASKAIKLTENFVCFVVEKINGRNTEYECHSSNHRIHIA